MLLRECCTSKLKLSGVSTLFGAFKNLDPLGERLNRASHLKEHHRKEAEECGRCRLPCAKDCDDDKYGAERRCEPSGSPDLSHSRTSREAV